MGPGIFPGTSRPLRTTCGCHSRQPTRRPLKMETRAHHVLIGAFAIAAFVVGLGFVLWLSNSGTDSQFSDYEVVFTEAVTGLSKGGLVQYNGIKVGDVTQLKL